ncbi:MAG TPA: tetratricopeptide repeat protein, partial [Candidatus Caenarcaniphilales bacterium]|nr:tetratricopeptide repeat protein [Candidatus Caenarcaniphilales bacterium]
ATVRELVGGDLPPDVQLRDLGEHRLKDLTRPEHLYQIVTPGLPTDFPPIRSLDTLPNNLPRQLSTFVGRNSEIDEVTRYLRESSLLSLTGPGGVGKTRLVLEVAARMVDEQRDGVWFVELGSVTDDSLVLQAIASTLRVKEQPGTPLLETLLAWLETRELLLVLDNCEHMLDTTASVTAALLRGCRSVKIAATTREPLGIVGERLYPVPPMSVPGDQRRLAPAEAAESEAVSLFTERARAVQPSFELTARNTGAVTQICRRLDGIPLAIELAAARVRVLPAEQIAARLDDRFRLLTGGSRTALPRHRTLRAALDWSYELLSDEERASLARLSVFAGGFTVEAAEAVCSTGELDGADTLDLLARLVDKSLVLADEEIEEGRYRLLETVRQYAQDKLIESGEAESVHRLHRDWYLALAASARPAFFQGPEPQAWLARLAREHDNLRAALQWTHEDPHGADAELRMVSSLWRFWEIRGHVAEGRNWIEQALERRGGEATELRANALTGAGILAATAGDHDAASSFLEQALLIQRNVGNPTSVAYAANNLANVALERADYARARELYEQAVSVNEAAGDRRSAAFALINLADVAGRTGAYEEAHEIFERSIGTVRSFGDLWGVAYAVGRSAQTWRRDGDLDRSRSLYQEALSIYRRMGD